MTDLWMWTIDTAMTYGVILCLVGIVCLLTRVASPLGRGDEQAFRRRGYRIRAIQLPAHVGRGDDRAEVGLAVFPLCFCQSVE